MPLIIENQLFPCIYFFKRAILETNITIETYETFQKTSFRNRYIIAGANGLQALTVPVLGGREQKGLIKEVEIDYRSHWNTTHWRSIKSSYSKSPYFEYYAEQVRELVFSQEKMLFNFNLKILSWAFKVLKTNVVIDFTTGFSKVLPDGQDLRGTILPKNFQKFEAAHKPVYPQVFEDRLGFQPNLSILDLLFCEGPNSLYLLNKVE